MLEIGGQAVESVDVPGMKTSMLPGPSPKPSRVAPARGSKALTSHNPFRSCVEPTRRHNEEHQHEPGHQFFFGIYPYICAVIFLLGSLIRFDRDQYTWRSESSQMLSTGACARDPTCSTWASLAFVFGHFFGMLCHMKSFMRWVCRLQKQLLAVVAGGTLGSIGLIGL